MVDKRNIREEEIKNILREDFFKEYDATPILGNVDFAVALPRSDEGELFERKFFMWAESKRGTKEDIYASFIQLILTIGKEKTHEKFLPPNYLGAFDKEKIAFIEFHHIIDVLYQTDFNWNVTPSDHDTKEFKALYQKLHGTLAKNIAQFHVVKEEKALRQFIRKNFLLGKKSSRLNITKNNYIFVFQRWVEEVKPSIAVDWNDIPNTRVVDFFFADLISADDYTRPGFDLAVVLRGDIYQLLEEFRIKTGKRLFSEASFNDNKEAYNRFWNKYERPPRKEYIDIMLERRERLIPMDLRRYTGAFFTPPEWVQKSQEYVEAELGENWQEEYYVWDCCAGTGNLLYGLEKPYRIWASTLDEADVQVMHTRIKEQSLNLLKKQVFKFDFLNDSFDQLPDSLLDIINDEGKREHLLIYINPPMGEAATTTTKVGTGENKKKIARDNRVFEKYGKMIGGAANEIYALFLMRIYMELPGCRIGCFSTLKEISSSNFSKFRTIFKAKLGRMFIVPGNTFDNVTGKFPIGFLLWDTKVKFDFKSVLSDVYDEDEEAKTSKVFFIPKHKGLIIDWLRQYYDKENTKIAWLRIFGTDVQNNDGICITSNPSPNDFKKHMVVPITEYNIIPFCIYFSVRRSIEDWWLIHRDQYLFPIDGWQNDQQFQTDCLIYTIFHENNRVQCRYGKNYWIPFSDEEMKAQESIQDNFMSDYIKGIKRPTPLPEEGWLFQTETSKSVCGSSLKFSPDASAVRESALRLWQYYHEHDGAIAEASYYDIRSFFQGYIITAKGEEKMNATSSDTKYNSLLADLKNKLRALELQIEQKVYEYGFLLNDNNRQLQNQYLQDISDNHESTNEIIESDNKFSNKGSLAKVGKENNITEPILAKVLKPVGRKGNVNITVNINKFEKPVGAVVLPGAGYNKDDINDVIKIKKVE